MKGDNMGCGCGNKKAEEKKFTRNAEYEYKGDDICLNGRQAYVKNEVAKTSMLVGVFCAIGAGVVVHNKMSVGSYALAGYAATAGLLTYGGGKGMGAGSKSANARYDTLCQQDDETVDNGDDSEESYMDEDSRYVNRS